MISYELKNPVKVGEKGEPITSLRFRSEVVAGDLRGVSLKALNEAGVTEILTLAGRLCGQPDVVMNRLSVEDFGHVAEVVLSFLQDGQPTTETT